MRKTRIAVTSVLATAAMVLAACGSTPGQAGDSSAASSESSAASSEATSGETSSEASSETSAATSEGGESTEGGEPGELANPYTAAAGEVGGPACGEPVLSYPDPGEASGTVKAGINELATSFNSATGHGNSTYNVDPLYFMNGPGLYYYDGDSKLLNNVAFGSCTLESLDPLKVKYTINPGVKWSDGVQVSAADIVLGWIASSGFYNTGSIPDEAYGEDGNLLPFDAIAFDSSSPAAQLVTDFPEVSPDGLSVTFTYSKFYVDYNLGFSVGVPAHVVAQKALGIDDPTQATLALGMLAQKLLGKLDGAAPEDLAALKKVSDTWNTFFDTTSMPSDPAVAVSYGPYVLKDWQKDQYMTFEPNPDYNWGPKASVKTIIWTYAPDPTAAVQSLENGDLDIINPQATTDVKAALEGMKDSGVETVFMDGATYEHIDLSFTNGGPFDPATYGGDAEKAKKVRQAFLLAVPRQQIVDQLIKPLNPDAVLRQSFTLFPGQPGYDDMVAQNGSDFYKDAGSDAAIAQAKALLAEVGVKTPVAVRYMYADNNPRRANEYALVAASAEKAGFNVVDGKDAQWASKLSDLSTHDAAMFAWQSQSTAVGEAAANFLGKISDDDEWGQNNFGQYVNQEVNDAFNDLNSQPDPKKQFDDLLKAEKHLWADGFGTTLFQFPDIVGYNSNVVTNVKDAPLSPTFVWNFWEWKAAA